MKETDTLEMLFRRHYRQLFCLAMTLLHDEAESKDVVSEVFRQMMESGREEGINYLLAAVRNRRDDVAGRIQHIKMLKSAIQHIIRLNFMANPLRFAIICFTLQREKVEMPNDEPAKRQITCCTS